MIKTFSLLLFITIAYAAQTTNNRIGTWEKCVKHTDCNIHDWCCTATNLASPTNKE